MQPAIMCHRELVRDAHASAVEVVDANAPDAAEIPTVCHGIAQKTGAHNDAPDVARYLAQVLGREPQRQLLTVQITMGKRHNSAPLTCQIPECTSGDACLCGAS